MRAHPDIRGLNNNWNELRPVVQIQLDLGRARDLGVSPQSIAEVLAARFTGVTVGEYRESTRLIPIVLRLPAQERDGLEDLKGLLVPSQSGQQVALSRLARLEMVWEPGIVWRQNREFALTLQASVGPGRQGPTVTKELMSQLAPTMAAFPAGLRLEVGGEVEESGRGQQSIFAGMPIMLFITLTLLVLQLQSSSRSFMVLATAPLGLSGAAAALLVLNRPFGFVAMLGVIALMGMIMRNSVILIDQIERERQARDLRSAIVEATVSRFRPILLTAAAAVFAMVPLQSSVFWGPMAVAIMGGLIVATALTLFSLPALYAAVYLRGQLRRGSAR
jgi:multidrug efflux pump subunit AcrB